jgi:hypothetical protein
VAYRYENARVADEVAALAGLNIDDLRSIWRRRFGTPPPLRSGDVMRRCLAEKIQLTAFGGDAELEARLAALVRAHRRGKPPAAARAKVGRGAVLFREYAGETHRVEALEGGFLWRGRTWRSLSEIAREITGSRWNGPRFFGLRVEPGT